ncbi:auxin-responsive protein SAUR68-like [Cynara cardunculus var. scolymus]|nr:auxin-responsive protein SAUR68-like [Cynara cardunculus var. scolymus]
MARKWQNLVALRRKRIAFPRAVDGGRGATIVDKGCFVVYASDGVRFVIPLDYLKNDIFQAILVMAEEEYGLQNDGPIRLPLRATFMNYTISQIECPMSKEREEELRIAITSWRCLSTSNLLSEQAHTQLLVC